MSEALIWTLLEAMQDTLQDVTTANGYNTDIGADVQLELPQFDAELESTFGRMVLAIDGEIAVSNASTRQRRRDFQVVAEVLLSADETDAQEKANEALQDLLDVIPSVVRYELSATAAADVQVLGQTISTRPEGMPCIEVRVVYSVTLQERLSA